MPYSLLPKEYHTVERHTVKLTGAELDYLDILVEKAKWTAMTEPLLEKFKLAAEEPSA